MKLAAGLRVASVALAVVTAAAAEVAAQPLPEGFVHLSEVDPTIVQDMRYAGAGNFLGRRVAGYEAPSCILTAKAARALATVQSSAGKHGYTVVVFDCYRPASAVADFVRWTGKGGSTDPRWYPATRRDDLIAHGYIGARSAHSRGSTVDLALAPLEATNSHAADPVCGAAHAQGAVTADFGTGFDCFDPKSHTDSRKVDADAQANRRLLVSLMEAAGFRNYPAEWWHFTLRGEPFAKKAFDFPVTAPDTGTD